MIYEEEIQINALKLLLKNVSLTVCALEGHGKLHRKSILQQNTFGGD